MQAPPVSYVCAVLLASHSPSYGHTPTQWHWRRLVSPQSDLYRPELYYMRGPGPRWREKHATRRRCG